MGNTATVSYPTSNMMQANRAAEQRQAQLLNQLQQSPVNRMDTSADEQSELMGQFQRLADVKNRAWEQEFTPEKAAARQNLAKYIQDVSSGQLDVNTQNDLMKRGFIGSANVGFSDFNDPNKRNDASAAIMGQLYGRGAQEEKARRMLGVISPYLAQNPSTEVALGGQGAADYEQSRKMYNLNQEQQRLNALLGGAQALTQGSQQAAEGVYQGALSSAAANANAKNARNAALMNTFGSLAGAGLGFAGGAFGQGGAFSPGGAFGRRY